jgi:hypothetical protein
MERFVPTLGRGCLAKLRLGSMLMGIESSVEVTTMGVKQRVRDLLDRLPDDCTLDDVLYHLYVVRSIQNGLSDADAGRVIPHAEVVEALRRRWQVGVGE